MRYVAIDFAGQFALLDVLNQLEEVDLVNAFSGQEFLFVNDAICLLKLFHQRYTYVSSEMITYRNCKPSFQVRSQRIYNSDNLSNINPILPL